MLAERGRSSARTVFARRTAPRLLLACLAAPGCAAAAHGVRRAAPGLLHHCGPGVACLASRSSVLSAHPLRGQACTAAVDLCHSCMRFIVEPHMHTLGRPGRRGCCNTRPSPTYRARCGPSRQNRRRGPRAARAPDRVTAARPASPGAPGRGRRTASTVPRMCAVRACSLCMALCATRAACRAAASKT